jgi:hypothetical protein
MGWQGTVVSVASSEPPRKQAARFVHITATNANVVIAYTAPWALSDAPSPPTSYAYRDLTYTLSRTADGDTTQAHLTCYQPGLWPGMTVALTSANYGLTAANFTVNEVTVTWLNLTHWEYQVDLGDPLVTMSVWANSDSAGILPITRTKITDGEVTTPKLAANAVTTDKLDANVVVANVANIGGTVVIDSTGVAITGGAMTVKNPGGTVIIDGTSDMFKIVATGTLTVAFPAGAASSAYADATFASLGSTYTTALPLVAEVTYNNSGPTVARHLGVYTACDSATGVPIYRVTAITFLSGNPGYPIVRLFAETFTGSPSTTAACRYYLLQEAGI